MTKIDITTEQFIAESINQHTRRFIAALLTDLESHLGGQDPEISRIVKDKANACKRIMYSEICKTEIESKHGS